MDNSVVFEDENTSSPTTTLAYTSNKPKGITGWLIQAKIAKTEGQASKVLLGIVSLVILLSLWLLVKALPGTPQKSHLIEGQNVLNR